MKAAEWKRTVRPLLPEDQRWAFRGTLCYRAPVGRFLFGVLGEGSGFDSGVYIWRVSMPLFVPGDVVVLSYSERISGGSKKYDGEDLDEVSAAIASGLRDTPAEDHELRRLIKLAHGSPNLRLREVAANSQVVLGDRASAIDTIRRAADIPVRYEWETEIVSRLVGLARTVKEKGIDAASYDIDAQAKRTAANLGLIH